jgi:hypothetical protein
MARDSFVQVGVPTNPGQRIQNLQFQTFVDLGDGNGPQLQTVQMQVVNPRFTDASGNPLGMDDIGDYEWKRQLLDEMRAVRLGLQLLLENNGKYPVDASGLDLLVEAQALRELKLEEET